MDPQLMSLMSPEERTMLEAEQLYPQPAAPTQLWRINDAAAQKSGPRKTIHSSTREPGRPKESYCGDWHNNMKEGMGSQIDKKGNKYTGMWHLDKRHGQGEFYEHIGNGDLVKRYSGEFFEGHRHGKGMLFGKNGALYDGDWAENMRHGEGKQVYSNGDIYEGSWAEGKREGFGRLTKSNGDIFEGNWLNDYQEGPGSYYYLAKKKRLDGEWAMGVSKCGIMSDLEFGEMDRIPEVYGADPAKKLPHNGLKDPRQVIKDSINVIRKDRSAARLANVPVEDIFGAEDLGHMRAAFHVAAMDDQEVSVADLTSCFAELGLEVQPAQMDSLMEQIEKGPEDTVTFEQFCRTIAMFVNIDA